MNNITIEIKATELAFAVAALAEKIGELVKTSAASVEEIEKLVKAYAAALPENTTEPQAPPTVPPVSNLQIPADPQPTSAQQPLPVQPPVQQQIPVQPPVQQPAPVQPQMPVAAPPTYTVADLQKACAPLMDAGKQKQIVDLINSFGVQALTEIPESRLGEFALALRGLGAQI